ncbi:MAG: hypothetical protein ACTHXO_09115 [Actinomycetaceae bacterium]
MSILNEPCTPSTGVTIPKLGLGTWFIDDDMATFRNLHAQDFGHSAAFPVSSRTLEARGRSRGLSESPGRA